MNRDAILQSMIMYIYVGMFDNAIMNLKLCTNDTIKCHLINDLLVVLGQDFTRTYTDFVIDLMKCTNTLRGYKCYLEKNSKGVTIREKNTDREITVNYDKNDACIKKHLEWCISMADGHYKNYGSDFYSKTSEDYIFVAGEVISDNIFGVNLKCKTDKFELIYLYC